MNLHDLIEYFNCEPFELNFRMLVFGGFWPLETDVRWKQIAISIHSFVCFLSLTSIVVFQAIHVYCRRNDLIQLSKDLGAISISYTIIFKSLILLYKIDMVLRLKRKFTEYKNSERNPVHMDILERSNRGIIMVIRTLYLLGGFCVMCWLLYPALDSEGMQRVPFPYIMVAPEYRTYAIWVTIYVYESLALLGFLFNAISVDAMFCGFVCRINAHYDIIIQNLKQMDRIQSLTKKTKINNNVKEALLRYILNESVKLHQELLKNIKLFEEIYSPLCSVHFTGSVIMTGSSIIDFVRIVKTLKLQVLQETLFIGVGLWDNFLYCYYASKMQHKSLLLSKVIYALPWHNMSPALRKDLMFFSFKCQQIVTVKVAHFFYLDLKTFVSFLKITYDLIALLFRTVKE